MDGAVRRVDHVALAVDDLAEGARLFQDTLGGRFVTGGDNDDTGIRLAHFAFAGFKVELLQPLRDDSLLAGVIRRRGTGFHHMTFLVDDVLSTESLLAENGYPTTGTDVGNPKWCETYIRPAASFNALLQFASSTLDQDWTAADFGFSDVLAGRVVWHDTIACLRETVVERAGWRN
jgi:methylmalonyl-CoA/ethylmalonyl-CoA epimerase